MILAHILLVEDNEGDILLTTEALAESKVVNEISVVRNGKEALDYVFKKGQYVNAKTPDIILLDVNLPLKNGHEVLHILKTEESSKHIPVIMLTTSSSIKDIDSAYANHANSYITKPVEIDAFFKAVGSIQDFWLQLVTLSKNEIE
jgi:CheY-like chemotaxis protein